MSKMQRTELQQTLIMICLICLIYIYFCIKNMLPFPDVYIPPEYKNLHSTNGIIEKDTAKGKLVGRVSTGRATLFFINDGKKRDFYVCSKFYSSSCTYFDYNGNSITLSDDIYAVPVNVKWYPYMGEKLVYEVMINGRSVFEYKKSIAGYKYEYQTKNIDIDNEKNDLKKALIILLITLVMVIKNEWKNRKI